MMKLQGIRSSTIGIIYIKFFQQKLTLSWGAAHAVANPQNTLFKACLFFLCLLRKLLGPISWFSNVATLFNCRDLWCSLHRCSCQLIVKKAGNFLIFLEGIVGKNFDNVNYSGKTYKFAVLIKFYHKSITSHRSWLFIPFQSNNVSSISCI